MSGLHIFGFYIFLSVLLYIDYQLFLRSGDSIFFKDKSTIEKDLRRIQRLEIERCIKILEKKTTQVH